MSSWWCWFMIQVHEDGSFPVWCLYVFVMYHFINAKCPSFNKRPCQMAQRWRWDSRTAGLHVLVNLKSVLCTCLITCVLYYLVFWQTFSTTMTIHSWSHIITSGMKTILWLSLRKQVQRNPKEHNPIIQSAKSGLSLTMTGWIKIMIILTRVQSSIKPSNLKVSK